MLVDIFLITAIVAIVVLTAMAVLVSMNLCIFLEMTAVYGIKITHD